MRYVRRRDGAYLTDQVVFGVALCVLVVVWALSRESWELAAAAATGAFVFGWWAVSRADRGTPGQRWAWLAIQVAGVAAGGIVLVREGANGAWRYLAVPVMVASWALAHYVLNRGPVRRVASVAAPVEGRRVGNSDARDAFGRRD
jgi:peptidoglycan biosynthesis protein MviN/MurJ (putative lipid II flippase)